MTVIAGRDHPLAILLADDLADMMRPDYDRADAGRTGVAPMGPVAREVVGRTRIGADQLPHLPATHAAGRPPRWPVG